MKPTTVYLCGPGVPNSLITALTTDTERNHIMTFRRTRHQRYPSGVMRLTRKPGMRWKDGVDFWRRCRALVPGSPIDHVVAIQMFTPSLENLSMQDYFNDDINTAVRMDGTEQSTVTLMSIVMGDMRTAEYAASVFRGEFDELIGPLRGHGNHRGITAMFLVNSPQRSDAIGINGISKRLAAHRGRQYFGCSNSWAFAGFNAV